MKQRKQEEEEDKGCSILYERMYIIEYSFTIIET